jgi:hypothetical protein
VTSVFDDPYDSREIGLCNVSSLDLSSVVSVEATEVHSKCGILSNATLKEASREPDGELLNPVPDTVRDEINSDNSDVDLLDTEYRRAFPNGVPTWTTFSLLLPPEN